MSLKDEVIKYIESTFSEISPETVRIYKNKFKDVKDKDIIEYFKHAKIRLYVNDNDVDERKVQNLVDRLNIVPQERMVLPYKANATTKSEVMIFPVQIRRLQQLATKKSNSVTEVTRVNMVGQADGDSKTAKITDNEINQLVSMNFDKVITELISPRSDNRFAKKAMNEQLSRDLTFSLNDLPKGNEGKSTLKYIDALYKCMNLATDFIDIIDTISYD